MKTLYNTVRQYESILDPNQDQTMNRMTDEMIRNRIREYCTYNRQKHERGGCGIAASRYVQITKIGKDSQGWYVETSGIKTTPEIECTDAKSFYDCCIANGQKMNKQKGFLIEDISTYFRWRKHKGCIEITDASFLESTLGLPEELDELYLNWVCEKSKKLKVHNKIKVILLDDYIPDLEISGNGCKDVIINPDGKIGNITVPNGVKIHRPKTTKEYLDLRDKLIH